MADTNYNNEVLRIVRLLTPEHQAELLGYVRLAQFAENSVKKSLTTTPSSSVEAALFPASVIQPPRPGVILE